MWYGCGNTSLPNPSTVRVGLKADGRIALHQGAVDIGQGSNTIVTQICADAVGAPIDHFDLVSGDTAITPDCGKTSASRQTFVTGKAAHMAGIELRRISCDGRGLRVRRYCFRRGCHHVQENGSLTTRSARPAARQYGYVLPPRPLSIRPPVRWMRTAKAHPMRSLDSARTWPRSKSIPNWERCAC